MEERKWLFSFAAAVSVVFLICAGEVESAGVFGWSRHWNRPERFDAVSGGRFKQPGRGKVTFDEEEKALRFEFDFEGDGDFWAYPRIFLGESEDLSNADYITFEMRVDDSSEAAGIECAHVMLGFDNKFYQIAVPGREYRHYVVDLNNGCRNKKEVRNIAIGMNPRSRKLIYWVKDIRVLGKNVPDSELDVSEVVSVGVPGTVFTRSDKLEFLLDYLPAGTRIDWKLLDWRGKELDSGQWPDFGRKPLLLEPLPDGYYRLSLLSDSVKFTGEKSFLVVPDPVDRPDNPDAFFCWDTAQSELGRENPENTRHPWNGWAEASEISRRCGVRIIRDRFCWPVCEEKPGRYNFDGYKENVEALNSRGIKISNLFYGCPEWAREKNGILPSDLLSLYRFAEAAGKFYDGKVDVWEFWNEEDIWFASESAWDFASAQKAAYLGFKAGSPDTPVAQGAISNMEEPSSYVHVMFSNGVRDYLDIFNVHSYAAICELPRLGATIEQFARQHGIDERPLWITENGTRAEGAGRETSYMTRFRKHSYEQELLVAEALPKGMITMQAAGVDRNFFFVLLPYNEQNGHKDWGLLRRDLSAKPAVAAQSNLLYLLADAELMGEMKLGDGLKGFLYRKPDGSQTLVFWSQSPLDTRQWNSGLEFDDLLERNFTLDFAGDPRGYNLFGTPVALNMEKGQLKLQAIRMPQFISGLKGLKADIPFAKRNRRFSPSRVDYDRTIVYQVKTGRNFKSLTYAKDYVELKEKAGELQLIVWNLSPEKKSGVVSFSGLAVGNAPEILSVNPFEKTTVPLEVSFPDDSAQTVFEVKGVFNGLETSCLRMPVVSEEEVARRIAQGRKEKLMFTEDPGSWRKNASGEMQISWDENENAVKFVTDFSHVADKQFWAYPEYVLQLPQESMRGALGITFEWKATPAADVNLALLMAVYSTESEHGKSFWLDVALPQETWESRTVIFKNQNVDPEKIRQIRIGMNPTRGGVLSYWIRNIRVIYPR